MKRRIFLGAAAAGLAITSWPAFLREAFGDECQTNNKTKTTAQQVAVVAAAYRRAQQAKKPLLVFVIPANDSEKWDRGRIFGELLNFGTDKDLAPLADVEVVCATLADLKKIVPSAGDTEPLMLLVKTDRVPAVTVPLDAKIPEYTDSRSTNTTWEEIEKAEAKMSERRVDAVGNLLRSVLGHDNKKLAARAASVRDRLTKKPPEGAHWASSSGCGTDIEGVESNMVIGCGMGHVAARSRRFLYFFSIESGRFL